MKLSSLAAVVIVSLIAVPVFAEPVEDEGSSPSSHRGPPPEAIEACDGKASGDACAFTGRRGEELEGTCGIGRGDGTQVACRPKNHLGESERRPRPRDEKGEE